MKLFSNILSKILYGCAFLVLLLVGAFFLLPHIDGFGALDVKIVKSGSMEPMINTGGVILIREVSTYGVGDVVTFTSRTADIPTTHRIIDTEGAPDGATFFVTKGDANEERDVELVAPYDILGKVLIDVPYIGFILDFARQPLGFALLIGIPALLIVVDEIEKIWKAVRRRRDDEDDENDDEDASVDGLREESVRSVYVPLVIPPLPEPRRIIVQDIVPRVKRETPSLREEFAYETRVRTTPRLASGALSVGLIFGLVSVLHPFGGTSAFYRNVETSEGNILNAETIDFLLEPDSEPVFTFIDGTLSDPDGALMTLALPTTESSGLTYTVSAEFATGSPAFCDAIGVRTDGPFTYFGVLTGLTSGPTGSDVIMDESLVLAFTLDPSVNVANETCVVDIVYRGWNEAQDPGDGYDDEERMTLSFIAAESALSAPTPFTSLTELSVFLSEEKLSSEEEEMDSNSGGGEASEEIAQEISEEVVEEEAESVEGETVEGVSEGEVAQEVTEEVEEEVESETEPEVTEEGSEGESSAEARE